MGRFQSKNNIFRILLIPALIILLVSSSVGCSGFKSMPHGTLVENSQGDGSALEIPDVADPDVPGPSETPQNPQAPQNPVPPAPPSFPPAQKTTYAALNANILQPKCTGCHNERFNAKPGVLFVSYAESFKNIIPGKPLESDMYRAAKRITPQNITTEQLQYIYDWILEGGQNN